VQAICTLWRHRKSCSRKGNDCNQRQQLLAGTNKQQLIAAALLSCLTLASAPAMANGVHEKGYFGGGYTSIGPGPYYLRHNAGRIGPLHEGRD
jgi:hypothetical protein